jgi:hypothetical protein
MSVMFNPRNSAEAIKFNTPHHGAGDQHLVATADQRLKGLSYNGRQFRRELGRHKHKAKTPTMKSIKGFAN